jgi:ferredoxin
MIDSIIKDRCTGCEGCASVCPTKCIDMVQNYEGFFMPQVNSNKCVNCKMCINICPVINYDKKSKISYQQYIFANLF